LFAEKTTTNPHLDLLDNFFSSNQGGFTNNVIILQDSTSPNLATDAENTDHATFSGKFIGRESLVAKEPRSDTS